MERKLRGKAGVDLLVDELDALAVDSDDSGPSEFLARHSPPRPSKTRRSSEGSDENIFRHTTVTSEKDKELAKLKFAQGKERQELITNFLKKASQVQLLFLFDATESMGPKIGLVKDHFLNMFEAVRKEFESAQFKVAVVAYRDFDCEVSRQVEVLDFTGNPATVTAFLTGLEATGGKDFAEDIFTGLQRATELTWKDGPGTRLIMHVADAPCHGIRFHKGEVSDDYPDGDPKGRKLEHLLEKLHAKCGVSGYFFSHITNHTVDMLKEFKAAAPVPGWLNDDHVGNDEALVEFLTESIISSLGSSMSIGGGCNSGTSSTAKRIKNYTIDARNPDVDWSIIEILPGSYTYHMPCFVMNLDEQLKDGKHLQTSTPHKMKLKILPAPFSAEGRSRYPFHALWLDSPAGNHNKTGRLHREERRMVVKEFKRQEEHYEWLGTVDLTSQAAYHLQAEVQTVAHIISSAFNAAIKGLPLASPIHFTKVYTVSIPVEGPEKFRHLNMEALLTEPSGETMDLIRFTNNNGAVSQAGRCHPHADSVLAFAHFSFEQSGYNLLVADLQGAWCRAPGKSYNQFIMSDPVIHSKRWLVDAPGNFGKRGIEAFFKTHKCNAVCQALGLAHPSSYVKAPAATAVGSTTKSRPHPLPNPPQGYGINTAGKHPSTPTTAHALLHLDDEDDGLEDHAYSLIGTPCGSADASDDSSVTSVDEQESPPRSVLSYASELSEGREQAIVKKTRYFRKLTRKCAEKGFIDRDNIRRYSNFAFLIKSALEWKVITATEAAKYHRINQPGNKGNHDFLSMVERLAPST